MYIDERVWSLSIHNNDDSNSLIESMHVSSTIGIMSSIKVRLFKLVSNRSKLTSIFFSFSHYQLSHRHWTDSSLPNTLLCANTIWFEGFIIWGLWSTWWIYEPIFELNHIIIAVKYLICSNIVQLLFCGFQKYNSEGL